MFARRLFSYAWSRVGLAAVFTSAALTAVAGAFNETAGVAIDGYDPVAYMTEQKAIRGSIAFTHVYQGSVFHFKSPANRDAFAAQPDRFAPQYGGYCAFGVSRGYKAVTSPDAFTVVDGKLYLNYNAEVKTMWTRDIPGFVSKADANWAVVEKTTKINR
ncbi:MAG: YHS domain-containing (seleno)protein [Betaproteobacteria bacterium]